MPAQLLQTLDLITVATPIEQHGERVRLEAKVGIAIQILVSTLAVDVDNYVIKSETVAMITMMCVSVSNTLCRPCQVPL